MKLEDFEKLLVKYLFDNFLAPIIFAFIAPLAKSIESYFSSGDYSSWISSIKPWQIYVFIIIFSVWIIGVGIRKRYSTIKKDTGVGAFTVSRYGYVDIGDLPYAGVIWKMMAPRTHYVSNRLDYTPSALRVRTPPRCPKCQTKIEESRSFWWGYVWKCPRCNWRKRSSEKYYVVSHRAEKIVQREAEIRFGTEK